MADNELVLWWASLPISQKERIARKALTKATPGTEVPEADYQYPACTRWWESLDPAQKQKIHDHCVDHHGYLRPEWNEDDPYGD